MTGHVNTELLYFIFPCDHPQEKQMISMWKLPMVITNNLNSLRKNLLSTYYKPSKRGPVSSW